MKATRRIVCWICTLALAACTALPSFLSTTAAVGTSEVTLSDGSVWLLNTDLQYNTLTCDESGRYAVTTTAPGSANSAFWMVSRGTYSLGTKYQLHCRESSSAVTRFGLKTDYSLDISSENTVCFIRQNGGSGDNQATLSVQYNGQSYTLMTTAASYTRNRVSTVGVVKQNGSWYMTWNDKVLDGAGCSEEVQSYCKLENYFPTSYLEGDAGFHFYVGASSLLTADSFHLKPDRTFTDRAMTVAADTYTDANNPATRKAVSAPQVTYSGEDGSYEIELTSTSSYAAMMLPVTEIDPETGSSAEFELQAYIDQKVSGRRVWTEYSFSNDPTFSDGSQITVWNALLGDMGFQVHFGYMNGTSSVTAVGTNANYYNDPDDSKRYFFFERDSKTGKIYLKFWGPNLVAQAAPHVVSCDFSSLAGKPIYMRVYARDLDGRTVRLHISPTDVDTQPAQMAELEEHASATPESLAEAEAIIAEYDSSALRYAVDAAVRAKVLETRNYMIAEQKLALERTLAELRADIDALPSASQLSENFETTSDTVITEIYQCYLRYQALGDDKDRLGSGYVLKLDALLAVLTQKDPDFANRVQQVRDFEAAVDRLYAVELTVENYDEVRAEVTALRTEYSEMDTLQKGILVPEKLLLLDEIEARLSQVAEVIAVITQIEALPEPSAVCAGDADAITAARSALVLLADQSLVPTATVERLAACEAALEEAKLRELDWYSSVSAVKYSGNNTDSYTFVSTANEVSGDVFATTTGTYDMTEDQLYWVGMNCGSGQFVLFGLSAAPKGQRLSQTAADSMAFILRPGAGNVLYVTFFDARGEVERVATISGFDMSGMHTFGFEQVDGHWYLKIDNTLCDGFSYNRLDAYMAQYGTATCVSIGARNGFSAANVAIRNKNAVGEVGEWAMSLPFGCSYTHDGGSAELNLKKGAQAVYQNKLEDLSGWSFDINLNLQKQTGTYTQFGFLANPDPDGNFACSPENGVVVRLVNRPAAGDNRTHVLLLLNGRWVTVAGKEPAIVDANYFTVSVERSTDRHYYIRIKWADGSYLVKFDRTSEYYNLVQLDNLVENGAYFTLSTSNVDLNANLFMKYSPADAGDSDDNTAVINYILDFEKHFDLLKAYSVADYEYMKSEWLKLSFMDRNSVLADLMDDELAYNMQMSVINYKDGDLDPNLVTTEEMLVTRSQLNDLIAQYAAADDAVYTVVYASDGSLIYTNSGSGELPRLGDERQKPSGLPVAISAALCALAGYALLYRGRKDRGGR